MIKNIKVYPLFVLIFFSISLFWISNNFEEFTSIIIRADVTVFFIGIIFLIIPLSITNAFIYKRILAEFNFRISIINCYIIMRLSQIAKYLPGAIFHHLSLIYFINKKGCPKNVSLSTFLYDGGSNSLSSGILVFMMAFYLENINEKIFTLAILISSINIILGGFLINRYLLNRFFSYFEFFIKKLRKNFKKDNFNQMPILKLETLLFIIFMQLVQNIIFGYGFYLLINSFLVGTQLSFIDSIFVATLVNISGYIIPFLPGGIGISDGLMMLLLGNFFPFEFNLSIVIIFRTISVVKDIFNGLLSVLLKRFDFIY